MSRTYVLMKYNDPDFPNISSLEKIIGVWVTKNSLLYYAKNNNITEQDAHVVVVIDNFRKMIKFVIYDWETRIVWRQPK